MSMSRSNNLSQKRVEQVCVKEKKCFKTLFLCVLQVNFFYGNEGESDENANLC